MGAVVSTGALSRVPLCKQTQSDVIRGAIRRSRTQSDAMKARSDAIRYHVRPCNQTQSDAIRGVRHLQSMLGRHLMAMQLDLRRAQPALQRRILLARIVQLLRDDLGTIAIRRALPTQPGNLLLRRRARIVTFMPLPSEESSEVIRGHQRSSEVIRGHQGSSVTPSARQSDAICEAIRRHQWGSSPAARGACSDAPRHAPPSPPPPPVSG